MSPGSSSGLMEAAAEVARIAGDVALRHFRSALAVETKTDGSPVTIADRSAERAAREWLEARFPDDGILGEELGLTRPDAPRRWILDPIDGTKSFIRGVPLWGSLVALVEEAGGENRVLAGAAYFPALGESLARDTLSKERQHFRLDVDGEHLPALGESLAAAPGAGTWWNGVRCAVSRVATIEESTVLTTDEHFRHAPARRAAWNALADRALLSRSWGDCYGYLLVATGRAEVMVDGILSPWDAAAFHPIIDEAGGVLTDWTGKRTAFGGDAIASNGALATMARRLLGVDVRDITAMERPDARP